MAETNRQDLQLSADGTWEPYAVFTAEDEEIDELGEALRAKGWESLLDLGSDDNIGFEINLYQRRPDSGHPEYLLAVWGNQIGTPFLKVDNLPAAMQLLSQWAPAMQAASIAHVVSDLSAPYIDHHGLVETLAARAAWGVQERLPALKQDRDQRDREAAERRRAARTPKSP
ncbi:hypothetical protein [Actinophytocola glycyrrhizae]|uniref:Uncharacterized protein n=1 Tax=Actinophytocola glycyrrhizae TaxID=2044873 RepID=A0ABV9SG93_9PSEU